MDSLRDRVWRKVEGDPGAQEARKAMVMDSLPGRVWREGEGDFGAREARKAMVINSLRGRFEGKGKKIPVREKREKRANSHTLPFPTPATQASNGCWSNFKENVYEARGMCYQHKRDLVCCVDSWKGLLLKSSYPNERLLDNKPRFVMWVRRDGRRRRMPLLKLGFLLYHNGLLRNLV